MDKEQLKNQLPAIYRTGKLCVAPGTLSGELSVPQSKSAAHRALIMGFLGGDIDQVRIREDIISDDVIATREALRAIGDAVSAVKAGTLSEPVTIDCKESGSTLRFLIPLVAVLGIPTRFIGRGRLPNRPIREYEGVFAGSGAEMVYLGDPGLSLPLEIRGRMRAGQYSLPGNVSSQYISGLLMALSAAGGESEVLLSTELESRPYVDMTVDVMHAFGIEVEEHDSGYLIPGGQKAKRQGDYEVEADYSQAAFWLVANYLGADISLTNLPKETKQGDRAIADLLEGLSRTEEEGVRSDTVLTYEMDARDVPDLVPVFSVAAAATGCTTKIVHAERLRLKESDRIAATADLLRTLGAKVEITEDGLLICGKSRKQNGNIFTGGTVNSYKDHRLVMAGAVAAVAAEGPVWITDPIAVEKSYPSFFEDYLHAGGLIYGINMG